MTTTHFKETPASMPSSALVITGRRRCCVSSGVPSIPIFDSCQRACRTTLCGDEATWAQHDDMTREGSAPTSTKAGTAPAVTNLDRSGRREVRAHMAFRANMMTSSLRGWVTMGTVVTAKNSETTRHDHAMNRSVRSELKWLHNHK